MLPVLEIDCLGGFGLRAEGEGLPALEGRPAEALLVYLAAQGRALPRASLAGLLWPESTRAAAQTNLRSTLYRLRRGLDAWLDVSRATVSLTGDYRLDTASFEELLQSGRTEEAVAMYRGEFLEGFHLPGSPDFEEWLALERERLRQLAIAAHQDLLARRSAAGDAERALAQAQALVRLEPLHEPGHRAVMRLLGRIGQRGAAIRHFDEFRRFLREEVGMEPDAATMSLLAAIRGGETGNPGDDPISAGARPEPAAPGIVLGAEQLPDFVGPLLGRDAELTMAVRRLTDPECRWLTIVGPGGVGKTRLAAAAAALCGGEFRHGVAYLQLVGLTSGEHVLEALAHRLGVDANPGVDAAARLARHLRGRSLLLILDNVEHLVEAAPPVAGLLRAAPGVAVLATSRTRLHLSEEWLLPLGGLGAIEHARELFALHAVRSDPSFALTDNLPAVTEICALVDSLPLALELAASWGGALRYEDIARELRADTGILSAPRPDLPPRHRNIELVFEASWQLLPDELRGAFSSLSVFRGGFTAAEARAVAGVTLPRLLALTDRSLVRSAPGGRFELHELLRRYAGERLKESGRQEEIARRHFEVFTELAEQVAVQIFGSAFNEGRARLAPEEGNVRAALEWAFASPERANDAARLLDAMGWYWRAASAREGRKWMERGRRLAGLLPFWRAALQFHAGHYAWMWHDAAGAESELRANVAAWDALGEAGTGRAALARCSLVIAHTYLLAPNWFGAHVGTDLPGLAESVALLEEARAALAGQPDMPWWKAWSQGFKGRLLLAVNDVEGARRELEACMDSYRRLANPWGFGIFSSHAAEALLAAGDPAGARAVGEEGLRALEEIGFHHAMNVAHGVLARIARHEGDDGRARRHVESAVATFREFGDEQGAQALHAELLRVLGWEAEGA